MTATCLRFGVWQDDDTALTQAIRGDAEVKLTGGPFTVEGVGERLAMEIANWRLHRGRDLPSKPLQR